MTAWISPAGVLSCSCDDWKRRHKRWPRHCPHTDALRKEKLLHCLVIGEYYFVTKTKTMGKGCMRLVQHFDEVVRALSAFQPHDRYQALAEVELAKFPIESA